MMPLAMEPFATFTAGVAEALRVNRDGDVDTVAALEPRHTFDPETGAVRRFVSGYDEPGGEVARTTSRNASP